ncbi:unnamed protein product [Caenorhabditis sp. 36 PRJEB53466]|nr:unnamed protein product [Caenorhabditis sp. 36 PRJEB53466]
MRMKKSLFILTIASFSSVLCHDGAPFDYFMFTTIYPTAVCRADDDSVPDSCEIPSGTPQWTIHGLWPNYENGSYPQNCQGTPKHFDEHLIRDIETQLRTVWPNLYPAKSIQSFWKHEYDKHGTCAQSDDRFDTELLYFKEVMRVHESINVAEGMASIGPSDKPINADEVLKALSGVTGGKQFHFNCLRDKKTKQFLLGDVRLCLNKDLSIRDCPDSRNSRNNRVSRFGRSAAGHQPLPNFQVSQKQTPDVFY